MIIKRVLRADRLRQVPPSFSWVDHRLVSERFIERSEPPGLALYLFLVTVGDLQGLSYYSDASICRRLHLDPLQLATARKQLLEADLIAYERPIYQVLSLAPGQGSQASASQRTGAALSVAEILRQVVKGGAAA